MRISFVYRKKFFYIHFYIFHATHENNTGRFVTMSKRLLYDYQIGIHENVHVTTKQTFPMKTINFFNFSQVDIIDYQMRRRETINWVSRG